MFALKHIQKVRLNDVEITTGKHFGTRIKQFEEKQTIPSPELIGSDKNSFQAS